MAALPEGTLTFLLTDLEASTRKWEAGPDLMRDAMSVHDSIVYGAVERNGGAVVESGREGDSVLAAFVRPKDAGTCALEIQRAFGDTHWPGDLRMKVRIALHTGEVELRGGHYFGPPLNRCARVLALAHGGQTLVTRATRELLAEDPVREIELTDLGLHQLKDLKRTEQVFQLTDLTRPQRFPPLRARPEYKTNLPILLTSFIGRRTELEELRAMIASSRLVTISGPGGAGKTRLAKQLALETAEAMPGGAWLVDLAAIRDPDLIPRAVASVLDVEEQRGRDVVETLTERCSERRMLLVLDDCEHLLQACAELAERLVGRCPELHVVATSREPLNVGGELIWRVPPLADDDGVRLFMERARARSSEHSWRSRYADTIARICRRLDGIPLAIELAAARTTVMTPDEILGRLETDISVLAGGTRTGPARQRTLEATIDWSHELLADGERILFRRLAVFAGRFSLEAAEAICSTADAAPDSIVEHLHGLVAKSLVQPVDDRFALLTTIRAYGRAKLATQGESVVVSAAHAAYYERLAGSRPSEALATWLDRMEDDHDDLREAIRWATGSDPATAARIAAWLYEFWSVRGHALEGRVVNEQLAQRMPAGSAPWARARLDAGAFVYWAGNIASALRRIDEGLDAARALDDRFLVVRGLIFRGGVAIAAGDATQSQAALDEALAVARSTGNAMQEAEALHHLGVLAGLGGDIVGSRDRLQESLALRRRLGAAELSGTTLALLATVAIRGSDLAAARRAVTESLEIGRSLRDRRVAWSLDVAACLDVLERRAERALRLGGAALAMFESTAQIPPPAWRAFTEPLYGLAREALGREAAEAAWRSGRALGFEEALHEALGPATIGAPA